MTDPGARPLSTAEQMHWLELEASVASSVPAAVRTRRRLRRLAMRLGQRRSSTVALMRLFVALGFIAAVFTRSLPIALFGVAVLTLAIRDLVDPAGRHAVAAGRATHRIARLLFLG